MIMLVIVTLIMSLSINVYAEDYVQVDENDFSQLYIDTDSIKQQNTQYGYIAVFTSVIDFEPGQGVRIDPKLKSLKIIKSRYAVNCDKSTYFSISSLLLNSKGKVIHKEGEGDVSAIEDGTYISTLAEYACSYGSNAKADEY